MKKNKIQLLLNRTVTRMDACGAQKVKVAIAPSPRADRSLLKKKELKEITLEVDKVVVCVGRQAPTRDLGLEALGLEMDARGWVVANPRMETNLAGVYAIGDLLGPDKIMLAHAASAEGLVAADNAMGASRSMDYRVVPAGIFTFPEIGAVGLTEEQAREQGYQVRCETFLFRGLGKSQATGHLSGQIKIVCQAPEGRILGVHIIGAQAAELINQASLALRLGATVEQWASTIQVHPTFSECYHEVSHLALDAGLHVPRN